MRELYEVSHDRLLMVASDRISVFDVVLPDLIPDKGRVLTGLSNFWFERTREIVANHVISSDPTDFPETAGDVAGRATLVRSSRPVPLECVVRGYLFGGGWQEYEAEGTVGGFSVPTGLRRAERLPEPLFTPTTKAESGHDIPLTRDEARSTSSARRRTSSCASSRCGCTSSGPSSRATAASSSPTRNSSTARSTARSSSSTR